ncbi:MAG: hypothetical protein H7Z10_15415 [Gemmatimonadaceae bacterium]|nr:hypothetical protein [Acetobacteraceae bacterium]
MIRLLEVGLFLAPLGAYILWRRTVARGQDGPSRTVLAVIFAGLLGLGGALAWFGVNDRLLPGERYVPAQIQDGRIVPGHGG